MASSEGWSDRMACDDCERCKALGYKFCIKCGEDFSETAEVPQHHIQGRFNPNSFDSLAKIGMAFFAVSIPICIAIILIYFGDAATFVWDRHVKIWLFLPVEVVITTVTGMEAQCFFAFLAAVAVSSLLVVLYESRQAFRDIGDYRYIERVKDTPLFGIGVVLASSIFLELIITGLMILTGESPEVPGELIDLTMGEALFLYTDAGVWEEIAFRMIPFGVPMVFAAAVLGRKDALRFIFGGFGISKLTVVLLVVTSLLFAFAHISGWGPWKMLSIMPGALMLGYLFARYGLHVSITAHILNDFIAGMWSTQFGLLGGVGVLLLLVVGLLTLPTLLTKFAYGVKHIRELPGTGIEKGQDSSDSSSD